jgi:hypothetical protein
MAAGDISIKWGTPGTFTISLASLATSTGRLAGQESDELNISSLGPVTDLLLYGKITTGTSPTTGRSIEVWAVATTDGTNYPAPFDGTGSSETIGSAELKNSVLRQLVVSIGTNATSNVEYEFSGISLASLFGGTLPSKVVLFVTHDTAVNLNSTSGNHVLGYVPVYENVSP